MTPQVSVNIKMQWGNWAKHSALKSQIEMLKPSLQTGQILVQFWKWLNKKIYPGIDQG